MKKLLLSLLGLFAFADIYSQCMIEVPLQQRATSSELTVEGKVIQSQSFWNTDNSMIYTNHVVEVYKIFKGEQVSFVNIITEGGTVGMEKIEVHPGLTLEPGDIGIFTLIPIIRAHHLPQQKGNFKSFEVYAGEQGFIKYDLNNLIAADPFHSYSNISQELYPVVLDPSLKSYREVKAFSLSNQRNGNPSVQAPSITNISPSTVTAGTGTTITITGSGFGSTQGTGTVGFRNADDGGATFINPLPTEYISWSNTQIVVEVPTEAGTGTIQVTQGSTTTSSTTLTVNYAHLNVNFNPGTGTEAYGTDHINDNGSGGYTWQMNTNFAANAAASASFLRAFDTWRCNTGINWTIGSTTSINAAANDGTNIICFDNTSPLSAGVLGVCFSRWSGCASGPTIVWYVNELDIIFDEGSNITPQTWEFGPSTPSFSEYDFETVAVHELGHGHQLGHVISPGAIMHYAISNGTSNRSLSANDLAAGNFVQAKSEIANACGPGAMTHHSCGTPPVANFSGSPTTICAGGSVAFTDLSTNTPTSWSWTFTGGTPSSSTSQNPTITYNTPGTYAVTLVATNASGSDSHTINGYITVNAVPSVSASSSPGTICSGNSSSLSASGATSYVWNPGNLSGSSVSVSPSSTTTYTVTGTTSGCSSTATAVVNVNATPTVTASASPSSICVGNSSTLSAGGASTYNWMPGNLSGSGVSVSPSGTTTYTVTGTSAAGCTDTETITVTVGSLPTVSASASPSTICAGSSTSLSGSGASTYTWMPGNLSGSSVSVSPASNTTYTVTGSNGPGCSNTATVAVTVNALPVVSASASPSTICVGNSTSLSAGGATSYTWMPGNLSGSSVSASPTVNTTYTVTGTSNGCSATATTAVTVTNCSGTTQLVQNYTNMNLSQVVNAITISGATNYEFRFTNSSLGYSYSRLKGNGIANMPLSWILGLQYGQTYNVEVRALVNSSWTAYGPVRTVAMAATIPTTQLSNCAATGLTISSVISCTAVAGAQDYEFEITNAQQPYSYTRTRGSGTNSIGLSWFPGLQYGRTYNVRVRAKVGGVWGSYGSTCTIAMASSIPTPTVLTCGGTYSGSQALNCSSVAGASNYEWRFVGAQTFNYLRGNNLTNCFANNIPGFVAGTYTVSVRAYVNGQWSAYGTPCTVTITNVTRLAPENATMFDTYSVLVYPNPSAPDQPINIRIGSTKETSALIVITDVSGRIINESEYNLTSGENNIILNDLDGTTSGLYFMSILVDGQVIHFEKLTKY